MGEKHPDSNHVTRRRLLMGAAGVAAAGAAAGVGVDLGSGSGASSQEATSSAAPTSTAVASGAAAAVDVPRVDLPAAIADLPVRQHGWEASETRDSYGNPIAPLHDRLLFFDVIGDPSPAYVRLLEASLRTLEHHHSWGPQGLLFTASWSPDYFEHVLGTASPIPKATAMSDFELPSIDTYHLCLHLASDDERRLADVEAALVHGTPLPGVSTSLKITDILRWRETRTGFVGAGLPAAHQDTGGIPSGNPVPKSAPLFMGFASNLKRNQASEDRVTIPSGPFAEGTTMAVSYMRLRLDSWYGSLSQSERVARMYGPQVTSEEAAKFTTDAASHPNELGQAIRRYGVVGHAQTSARARRKGSPVIQRRDFNTVDGGQAGLHFVCIQRSIDDFVATRKAMNATSAQLQNPAITDTVNNGINEFIFVLKRANYILPPRHARAFPLLPDREREI